MAERWQFMDYVTPGGENVIHTWLHGLPVGARAKINRIIAYLETTERLGAPYTKNLRGECAGLLEIRVGLNNVQYRPLGWYGPGARQVTLLMGAIERGDRFEPLSACSTALMRKAQMGERGRTREHDFN